MKFRDVKTLEHLLKEYGSTPGAPSYSNFADKAKSTAVKAKDFTQSTISKGKSAAASLQGRPTGSVTGNQSSSPSVTGQDKEPEVKDVPVMAKDLEDGSVFKDSNGKEIGKVVSKLGSSPQPKKVVIQTATGDYELYDPNTKVMIDEDLGHDILRKVTKQKTNKKNSIARKIKKLSRKRLKEADPKLFEINFNKKEIAQQGLDAPVKCGFEAETFFYSVEDRGASDDVDNMSISDVEYEYGDLPDSAYSDYNDWIMEKAMDEYLPDLIDNWIEENRDEDEYIRDFMNSGDGPTEDAVEEYRENFKEDDPNEYENREEDGWDDDNWARDLINEEYDEDYGDFLRDIANEDDQLRDDAVNECEGDYSMEDWINDQYYSMSAFLDDYGYEYSRESGSVEGVASELYSGWIEKNSKFNEYPEYGEYGSTGVTDRWAVETDSSIDPDEGAGAELISPVFSNARQMLKEMKSLFEWSEGEFGTNSSTGLHITMSWQGNKSEPNKLKMAMLIGDEYLLDMFGRLRNSYTKSQYRNVLRYAEEIDAGNLGNFSKLEKALTKGISSDKFSSINFKGQKDSTSSNELIEFRIAGGRDYNEMYKEVVQACVRYGTIMKAGYEPDAFRQDYIKAVSRLLRKSKEVDPKTAKEFDEINAPIIDSAKELVSKKEYFDVLKSLEISLRNFQQYEEALDPEADKKWKQSVKDYEKGTGRKVGADLKEEEITGYIEPSAIPPSRYAESYLKKARESFIKAVAILAKDISTGTNRGNPNAKSIRVFRDYANQLKLDDNNLQDLLVQQIDDIRPEYNDKENIALLDKGVKALFRKDLIQTPEFLSPQNVDQILKQVWQFAMSDDKHDNTKLDQLVKLLQKVSPHLEYDEIAKSIESSLKARQENEFVRYMKSGSYGDKGVLKTGKITTPGASEELLKFLQPYSGYKHPTSPDHHVNIRSDDRYSQVFQMRLMQRLRDRLEHLKGLEIDDPEKANKLKEQLCDIGIELLEGLRPEPDLWDGENSHRRGSDSEEYLAVRHDLEMWNSYLDKLVRIKDEIGTDDATYNFASAYDDYVLGSIHLDRYFRYKENNGPIQAHFLKELIKERFAVIKKFYSQFDKIFQKEGFVNLKAEIQAKNTLDRRNKDFEKNVRDNAKAKLNIPSHAYAYIKKDFYDNITDEDYGDRAAYLENHLDDFSDHINSNRVWVIPAAHWGQAHDAKEGLELIQTFEKADNYYHTWRKTGYNKILSKFARVHNIPFNDLVYNASKTYIQMGGDEFAKLQNAGIEITRKGDSRAGVPGQDYLIDPEDLANPISQEPIDRGSAMMWNQSDDEEKEMKRFKAFDWSVYPEKMKVLVAKQLKDMKADQGYYSFKVALEDVLKKVVDGDIDIALRRENNVDGMAQAAGVEDMDSYNSSSNQIASKTNWNNLARYLGINLGVNDQGVNLLKKVYDQYDSDHNWRPEPDPDAIGIKRWAGAVKAAVEYIQKNYTVSAGNYFRKDAEGNAGDDVSNIYGNDQSGFDVTTQDYENMRRKYQKFDYMMITGIQNYIVQPDVNRLVGFLKNPDNDETFKDIVLRSMTREREAGAEPNDFQGALARGRMHYQGQSESVFAKFDKLPLSEQIAKLENIDANRISQLHGKFVEGSLNRNELSKDQSRFDAFINKIKAGIPFQEVGGGEIILHPDMIKDVTVANDLPDPIDIDGNKVTWKRLEKTAEFGSRTGGEKVSNKGEVAEGILGCATFARLLKRPIAPITDSDIKAVMKRLPTDAPDKGGWHELTLTARETDSPIADFFTLTLNLKSDTYKDFINPEKWPLMNTISNNVVEYVNDNMDKYTKLFAKNGKVDAVKVIADGVSGETDTKVDVFLTHSLDGGPERTLQHYDMSVKVGSTKQMGQVGGGPTAQGVSTERFFILKEMFEKFGADLSVIENQFMSSPTINDAYVIAYREAAKQINTHLTTEDKEVDWLIQFLDTIKFFATLNDDRVKLVQFEDTLKGGYYVLDFKKLDRMMDKNKVDLEAVYIDNKAQPKITIINKVNNKPFLSIRKKQAQNEGYIRNYIEKEKGLVELIKVRGSGMRKKVESVNEGAVPNNDTVRKLKEILAKPLLTNDIKSQMYAYVAIPDPSMIRDFRAARASYGDNHDLRSIVKSYAKLKLHDDIKKQFSK